MSNFWGAHQTGAWRKNNGPTERVGPIRLRLFGGRRGSPVKPVEPDTPVASEMSKMPEGG